MTEPLNRRQFLAASAAAPLLFSTSQSAVAADAVATPATVASAGPGFRLGLISYNLGAKWDLPLLLKVCSATGIAAVEFRTTHAHGVEPSLSPDKRSEVKKRCADAGVLPWGIGSACEFHSADAAEVKKQIDQCREFVKLAADIGAKGVKVRPNGFPDKVPVEKTLEQIGASLAECGKFAADAGVEIWVEVHGKGTQHPPHVRTFMDRAAHPSVSVCWNSNPTDLKDGSIGPYFDLLKKDIKHVHINELVSGYPYRDLFKRLREIKYDRFTMIELGQAVAEDPKSSNPAHAIRFLKYYKALWEELARG